MKGEKGNPLTLSVYVTPRGYSFTLFEGLLLAVDWGTRDLRGASKKDRCVATLSELLDRYAPDYVVIEEWRVRYSQRPARVRQLYRAIERLAVKRSVRLVCYPRQEVIMCFKQLGADTKQQRVKVIARQVLALKHRAPPKRDPWRTEHPRMGIFEAASLNMVHFHKDMA